MPIRSLNAAVIATALSLSGFAAQAHEWYPPSCCDNRDCYPMGAGQREPDPRYTPSGWLLHDGRLVPFVDARVSPDGKFHVCRIGGRTNASIVHPTGDKPCLYVPPTAF